MVRRQALRGVEAAFAAFLLAGIAVPQDLGKVSRQLRTELELEILARRAEVMGEKLDAFSRDLQALKSDAQRLKRRADTARTRKDRDPFFPFDLSKFKDDVWRRALWMRERRWEGERLELDVMPDDKLARKLTGALEALGRAAKQVEEFDAACLALQDSANATDRSLIGGGAAWDAAAVRSSSQEVGQQLAALEKALERAQDDASRK